MAVDIQAFPDVVEGDEKQDHGGRTDEPVVEGLSESVSAGWIGCGCGAGVRFRTAHVALFGSIGRQVACGGETFVCIACEHLAQKRRPFGESRVNLVEKAGRALEPEPRQALEEENAEGIDVGSGRGFLAAATFGCKRVGRAEIAGKGCSREVEPGAKGAVGQAGDSEVGQDKPSLVVDQDVLGFDVPVDDSVPVAERKGAAQFVIPCADGGRAGWFSRCEPFGKRTALDAIHDEVGPSVRQRAEIGDANDARMPERGENARLGEKLCGEGLAVLAFRRHVQHLDGVARLQHVVDGLVDDGHAAAPDFHTNSIAFYRHHRSVCCDIGVDGFANGLRLARLVPIGVSCADHHGVVHDGKDVDFFADMFVNDSIGKAVCLPKVCAVGWRGEEAFLGHGIAEFGIWRENADGTPEVIVPTGCSLA